ncbi:hypothetical protein STENM223S_08627 [Streptomyces tendae]
MFCTAIVSTCMHRPMPVPMTNMYSDSSHEPVSGPMRDIRNRPAPITSVPTIGKIRYRPVLLTTPPLKTDAMGGHHHQQRPHAGHRGRVTVDVLEIRRQIRQRAEHTQSRR